MVGLLGQVRARVDPGGVDTGPPDRCGDGRGREHHVDLVAPLGRMELGPLLVAPQAEGDVPQARARDGLAEELLAPRRRSVVVVQVAGLVQVSGGQHRPIEREDPKRLEHQVAVEVPPAVAHGGPT